MSKDKAVDKAKKVAAALADAKTDRKQVKADEKVSKKASKNKEKAAKSSEYSRPLHQDGVFGGAGAQARARQRHFDSTGQRVVRHPGVGGSLPTFDRESVPEDTDGIIK